MINCSLFGVGSEEQPSYKVILKKDNKEIRKYNELVVAKTTVTGSFKESQSKAFKLLAGYIFGKNRSNLKMKMTSPVTLAPKSEKIAMTAPVVMSSDTQDNAPAGSWTMTFTMPSKYTIDTLPIPVDDRVTLEKVPERYVAAYTFSGFWSASKNQKLGKKLLKWLSRNKQFIAASEPKFAGYNPPWTLPFFRRNEMLVELSPVE